MDWLEKQIQQLLEGSLERLLGGPLSLASVAGQLARAMEDGFITDGEGKLVAPDRYSLSIHPEDASDLYSSAPDLPAELARTVMEVVRISGVTLADEPHVTITADPDQMRGQVHVSAWHAESAIGRTRAMASSPVDAAQGGSQGAYLLVDKERCDLDRSVIKIGRHPENDLVLDNPYVSRWHAEVRLQHGRFVLIDMGAKAGVHVNGRPIRRHVLSPGDVISIGDVRLVYGEDAQQQSGFTQPYTPPKP